VQDTSDIRLTNKSDFFGYTVTRRGMADSPITVAIIPLNNILSVGSPVTISSIPNFAGTSSGAISYSLPLTITNNTAVRYVWQVTTGGVTISDTIVKIYNPSTAFYDDMEGTVPFATNWTLSGTGSAWTYSATGAFAGSNSLSQASTASYGTNIDQSVVLKTAVNLTTATQAYLSFMMKYGTESCQDRLQVEVTTNGGTTWTPVPTRNTIVESGGSLGGKPAITGASLGWVREIVDLRAYTGGSLQFRFRLLSNGTNRATYSTAGFNIDNLSLITSNAVILPVSFEDLTATRQYDQVLLQWKAVVDGTFSYYEVQRSADGADYETIGTLYDGTASAFTDKHPLTGTNYYRIRVVDRSNASRYSKTVFIVFTEAATVSVFPNPVSDKLNLQINSASSGPVTIELTSLDGKLLHQESTLVRQGANMCTISMVAYAPQLYLVKVRDEKGNIIKTIKVMKAQE
jgi:carboxypeptidase T